MFFVANDNKINTLISTRLIMRPYIEERMQSCRNRLWKKHKFAGYKCGPVKVLIPGTIPGTLVVKDFITPDQFRKPIKKKRAKIKLVDNSRDSERYSRWRAAVLSRDLYKCVLCESKTRIEAHHIIRWVDNEKARFNQKNGVAICYECHQKHHNYNKEPFPLNVTMILMKYIDYRYERARLNKVPRAIATDYNAVQAVNSRTNKNVPG
jgi:hypothetical protein